MSADVQSHGQLPANKKRLSRILVYLLLGVLALGILVYANRDALWSGLALQLVQRIPGVSVSVDGPFEAAGLSPMTVNASGLDLAFDTGTLAGTRSRMGEVQLQIHVWPLLQGQIDIDHLSITDADIEISGLHTNTREPISTVTAPLLRDLLLERIRIRFQRTSDSKPHELDIALLQGGAGKEEKLKFKGTASLDGDALEFSASSGSVEQL